jgi:hypothetical protein
MFYEKPIASSSFSLSEGAFFRAAHTIFKLHWFMRFPSAAYILGIDERQSMVE